MTFSAFTRYVAAILQDAGSTREKTLDSAEFFGVDEVEVIERATVWAGDWIAANTFSEGTLQIVKDGKGIRTIPIEKRW